MQPRSLATRVLACSVVALLLARSARAQAPARGGSTALASPSRVVEQFHAALAAGDSGAAAALLDTAAVILESGDLETRAEYLAHHLPADIEFARAVHSTRQLRRAEERDGTAWVVSTSRSTGEFKGRAVDGDGAELIVLARSANGWRIVAIHWSSHRHR